MSCEINLRFHLKIFLKQNPADSKKVVALPDPSFFDGFLKSYIKKIYTMSIDYAIQSGWN
jgi:hypothetical protein